MAPVKNAKQTLLRMSDFVVAPSKTMLKKHKKLEKKMGPFITGKPRADKKREEQTAEEKKLEEGAEAWQQRLPNINRSYAELMYVVNGCNGPRPMTPEDVDDVDEEALDSHCIIDTLDDV
jgi:hypothetical protein